MPKLRITEIHRGTEDRWSTAILSFHFSWLISITSRSLICDHERIESHHPEIEDRQPNKSIFNWIILIRKMLNLYE